MHPKQTVDSSELQSSSPDSILRLIGGKIPRCGNKDGIPPRAQLLPVDLFF